MFLGLKAVVYTAELSFRGILKPDSILSPIKPAPSIMLVFMNLLYIRGLSFLILLCY